MKKRIIGIVVVCILAGLLIFSFYKVANREDHKSDELDVEVSVAQELLLRNLDIQYPPTPREVVKFYNEITQCFYNETYSDDELTALGLKIQQLYDPQLVANKSQEDYLRDLRADILEFKGYHRTIVSYTLSSSLDIENTRFTMDGYEWVKVYSYYTIRSGGQVGTTAEVFLLRKDESGHWKIFGWDLAE